jgi:very-short-patch-repair endonuclease
METPMIYSRKKYDLQQEEDARREKVLRELELRVVRFGNEEVLRDASQSAVLGRIQVLISM